MAENTFNLTNRIKMVNAHSDINVYYGPHASLEVALEAVDIKIRGVGLTIGIMEDGKVVEYWWKAGVTNKDLVVKAAGGSGTVQSVNSVSPDANGNILLNIPDATSDLSNDSNFAVDANYVHTDNNFTTELKDKLSGLEDQHYKGTYASLVALQTAYPTGVAGDYADVDTSPTALRYIWSVADTAWVVQVGASTSLTAAQVKTLYENNPDTNAFTDEEKTKLAKLSTSSNNIFTSDFTVRLAGNKTLGRYTNGMPTNFAGKTFEQVIRDIAIEYLAPSFSSFTVATPTTVEVGTTLTGTLAFTFNFENSSNVTQNTVSIKDVTRDITLISEGSTVSPKTIAITDLRSIVHDYTNTWIASATNTQNNVFNSRNFSINWRYKNFYGNVDEIPTTSSAVRGLNSAFSTSGSTFSFASTKNISIVVVRPGQTLVSVKNTVTNVTITEDFKKNQYDISIALPGTNAGGGTDYITYKMYAMINAVPLMDTVQITLS